MKWVSIYLTTGHLGRSYFLMMCGMNWFGFYCSLTTNSKFHPKYQGSVKASLFFSFSILFMDILIYFVKVGGTSLSFQSHNSPCLNWSTWKLCQPKWTIWTIFINPRETWIHAKGGLEQLWTSFHWVGDLYDYDKLDPKI